MKKLLVYGIGLFFMIAAFGCSSGSNTILDKAAITKANGSIKDLQKFVGAYKMRYGTLPPPSTEKSLFDSLEGIITEVKKADFLPSLDAVIMKTVDESFSQKYSSVADEKDPTIKNDIRNKVIIEKLKETNKARYDEIYTDIKMKLEEIRKEEQKNKKRDKTAELKTTEPGYDDMVISLTTKELDSLKYSLLDDATMKKVKENAKRVYKQIQPPFNTDVKNGGWEQPKWIIEMPSIDAIVANKVKAYKQANGDREPSPSQVNKFKEEAKVYALNNQVGYLIWMANDSKNTLVYAKLK